MGFCLKSFLRRFSPETLLTFISNLVSFKETFSGTVFWYGKENMNPIIILGLLQTHMQWLKWLFVCLGSNSEWQIDLYFLGFQETYHMIENGFEFKVS